MFLVHFLVYWYVLWDLEEKLKIKNQNAKLLRPLRGGIDQTSIQQSV
jgi:hypothetical protein